MIDVGLIGASGYIGGEVLRGLVLHPHFRIKTLVANESAGRSVSDLHPALRGLCDLQLVALGDAQLSDVDAIVLALPNGESSKILQSLPNKALVDTGSDHRQHPDFTYGIPELFRARIRSSHRIAAAGCFATAVVLALAPVVKEELFDGPIIVNGITGSSGSGAKPAEKAHHPFRNDSLFAYEPFHHRHVPEIRAALGGNVDLVFQPHSGPFARGIFVTCVISLKRQTDVLAVYSRFYQNEPFVRVGANSPNLKWVLRTNYADLGIATDGLFAIVTCAIDNLVKGGGGQAVQCLNTMFGFPEDSGLKFPGSNP